MKDFSRASGILLHPTALPGPHGIGTLSEHTLSFLDWLKDAGQSYWQICPLVPTGYGDSPYQGFSAFAGNPNLIDLGDLVSLGLLDDEDLTPLAGFSEKSIDFGSLIPRKAAILHKARQRFIKRGGPKDLNRNFLQFRESAAHWLEDYSLFMALKESQGGKSWDQWPEPLKSREPSIIEKARKDFESLREYHTFIQFIFDKQWKTVKQEAADRGVRIIGDLPIFVSFDSADCWSQPENFQLDSGRRPTHVAGVPPDYFSTTGQLWGNPLYNWPIMEENDFRWWISVLKSSLERYDVLRIDHFRGFAAYWAIPYGEQTAINGEWIPAPGRKLFQTVKNVLGTPPIIAEDLGVITDDVRALINEFGFPGMKILQFAFDSSEENDYLPHNYSPHCIVYTGTHDNDTTAGWYDSTSEHNKAAARTYLNLPENTGGKEAAKAIVKTAMNSAANLAVTPLQDILGLGSEGRFNTPGTAHGNWTWRTSRDAFSAKLAEELKDLTLASGRLPLREQE